MAGRQTAGKTTAKTTTSTKTVSQEKDKTIIPKSIDPEMIIPVKNGFNGKLVYISPRTHERFVWETFGAEQDMELRELKNARSSAKAFFEKNWFMFSPEYEWVIQYLGLTRLYENAIKIEEFDEVFKKSPAQIKEVISKLSDGQKKSLSYRARQLVANKEIDSLKTISILEEALGTELIEK